MSSRVDRQVTIIYIFFVFRSTKAGGEASARINTDYSPPITYSFNSRTIFTLDRSKLSNKFYNDISRLVKVILNKNKTNIIIITYIFV